MTDYQVPFQKKSRAFEFRRVAREALKGKYWLAFGVFLLASVLSAFLSDGSVSFEMPKEQTVTELVELIQSGELRQAAEEAVRSVLGDAPILELILIATGISAIFSLALTVFVGAPTAVGYAKFNLELIDGDVHPISESLFSGFRTGYLRSVKVRVLLMLINFAISLLAVIPLAIACGTLDYSGSKTVILLALGIFAILSAVAVVLSLIIGYRYALCTYIMAEYPELSAIDVLKNSAMLMKGNKLRLFCLHFSFIGWLLLGVLACGLGALFVPPYMYAAEAAFYSEVSGREKAKSVEFPSLNLEDYFSEEK